MVWGLVHALCILMNISYYRYSIVWGVWCLVFGNLGLIFGGWLWGLGFEVEG